MLDSPEIGRSLVADPGWWYSIQVLFSTHTNRGTILTCSMCRLPPSLEASSRGCCLLVRHMQMFNYYFFKDLIQTKFKSDTRHTKAWCVWSCCCLATVNAFHRTEAYSSELEGALIFSLSLSAWLLFIVFLLNTLQNLVLGFGVLYCSPPVLTALAVCSPTLRHAQTACR